MNRKELELRVLLGAKQQLETEGGYTNSSYVERKVGGKYIDDGAYDAEDRKRVEELLRKSQEEGKNIVAVTCAIGSVEHALWQETGRVVTEDERDRHARDMKVAVRGNTPLAVYDSVMARLNRHVAKREHPYRGRNFQHFEEPNVDMPTDESLPIVVEVIDDAIAELKEELRS